MPVYLALFILIPLTGFLLTCIFSFRKEKTLSLIALFTATLNFVLVSVFICLWMAHEFHAVNYELISLYGNGEYRFMLEFYFDKITAVYLLAGSFLTVLITLYSRTYMHRETGYKRFFITLLFFLLGYNTTVLSGNFETLFVGWEFIGIASFLLISFYRNRYLPVRNAVKVFSIYRIGDVGILLAMWASHHLWQKNVSFSQLSDYQSVTDHLNGHSLLGAFIGFMILLAAAAKSAQLPFSYWLPRAMEGPTPSSAIFYGSLSVHFGVFLLLRTHPFWEHQFSVRTTIFVLGILTSIVASSIGSVQSSIKTQIAYSSVTQIGLIFVEIALGWETLALIHFCGNAFLRTYQLLISPSVVIYLVREQFYNPPSGRKLLSNFYPKKWQNSLFLLNMREWGLDQFINKRIFNPLKKMGHKLDFLTYRNLFFFITPAYILSLLVFIFKREMIPEKVDAFIPYLYSFIGLMLILKSFSERKYPRLAWLLVVFNHLWMMLAVSFSSKISLLESSMYLSGILAGGLIGFICLQVLKKREPHFFDLNQYYGHVYEYPRLAFAFFLCCLALMGFPISLTFIGEDLVFSHIHHHQYLLAFFNSVSFIMAGIAIVRIHARLFLGAHIKKNHESAIKSA